MAEGDTVASASPKSPAGPILRKRPYQAAISFVGALGGAFGAAAVVGTRGDHFTYSCSEVVAVRPGAAASYCQAVQTFYWPLLLLFVCLGILSLAFVITRPRRPGLANAVAVAVWVVAVAFALVAESTVWRVKH